MAGLAQVGGGGGIDQPVGHEILREGAEVIVDLGAGRTEIFCLAAEPDIHETVSLRHDPGIAEEAAPKEIEMAHIRTRRIFELDLKRDDLARLRAALRK